MKKSCIILVLGLAIASCSPAPKTTENDAIPPEEFQALLDTICANKDLLTESGYFLYDITGDGIQELWTIVGTCEANKKLKAYTIANGKPKLIYDGDGGHSDYFVYDGQLVCVACNTGAGGVVTYTYDGERVVDSVIGFSTWTDDGESGDPYSIPHDARTDSILDYWSNNYGNYIKINPL